jgi:hypothetical protein
VITGRVGRGDDTVEFGQFGELFLGTFERELARGACVEADDSEHLAADFEDEVFLP